MERFFPGKRGDNALPFRLPFPFVVDPQGLKSSVDLRTEPFFVVLIPSLRLRRHKPLVVQVDDKPPLKIPHHPSCFSLLVYGIAEFRVSPITGTLSDALLQRGLYFSCLSLTKLVNFQRIRARKSPVTLLLAYNLFPPLLPFPNTAIKPGQVGPFPRRIPNLATYFFSGSPSLLAIFPPVCLPLVIGFLDPLPPERSCPPKRSERSSLVLSRWSFPLWFADLSRLALPSFFSPLLYSFEETLIIE